MEKTACDRGVKTLFEGKTKKYTVETYITPNGGSFTNMPECSDLVDIVTGLYLSVYPDRDRAISIERMKKSLSYPRTIIELVTHQNIPVGFGIFPRLLIDLPGGRREPVIYSTRAFEEDHEGEGLGTHVLSKAIRLHQEETLKGHRLIRFGVLMTQNPLSVYTLEKGDDVEENWPFGGFYNRNTEDAEEAQSIMLGVHAKVRMSSESINTYTGVSKGELSEIGENDTWKPSRGHTRVFEIYQTMIRGLEMNRERGDVVYVTFRLKRPNLVFSSPLVGEA